MPDQDPQLHPPQQFVPAFEGLDAVDETMGPRGDHKLFQDDPTRYLTEKRRQAQIIFDEFCDSDEVKNTALAPQGVMTLSFDNPLAPVAEGSELLGLIRTGYNKIVFAVTHLPNPRGPDFVLVQDNTDIAVDEGQSDFGFELMRPGDRRIFGDNEQTRRRFRGLSTLSGKDFEIDFSAEGQVSIQNLAPTQTLEVLSKE